MVLDKIINTLSSGKIQTWTYLITIRRGTRRVQLIPQVSVASMDNGLRSRTIVDRVITKTKFTKTHMLGFGKHEFIVVMKSRYMPLHLTVLVKNHVLKPMMCFQSNECLISIYHFAF